MHMKYFLLTFLITSLTTGSAFSQNLTADQVYKKTTNAIVTIYTFDRNENPISQGSGVVLNQKGWVVTNYHVYNGADKIIVKHGNKIVPYSEIIAYNQDKDILILKINDRSFPSIPVGNSDILKIGQKIYAIGSPLGLENTISEGIISGLRQSQNKNFIQISAAISSGSSGGAVLNTKGELIAITTSTITKGQNLNFAIPVNEILNLQKNNTTGTNTKITRNYPNNNSILFPIQINNTFGFIDKNGSLLVEPRFEDAREFHDGLAGVKVNGKWGYIDYSGNIVIQPTLSAPYIFENGFAPFKSNGLYGFIDKRGNIAIPPKFSDVRGFSEGLALVTETQGSDKKYGYINIKGEYVITPQFSKAGSFNQGLAPALKSYVDGYTFINKNGIAVLKLNPKYVTVEDFSEGFAVVGSLDERLNPYWKIIDKKGTEVSPALYYSPNKCKEGLFSVTKDDKWGFINSKGEIVVYPQFEFAWDFSEGLAGVQIGKKYGFIDKSGTLAIPATFDFVAPFQYGLAMVKVGNSWNYINKQGQLLFGSSSKNEKPITQNEDKDGFKSLKIGDAYSKYSSSLTLLNTNSQTGTKTYNYRPTDYDLYNVFNVKMDKILLTFNKSDQLVDITLIKSYRNSTSMEDAFDDSKNLDPYFNNLFGKPIGKVDVNTSKELKLGRVWGNSRITVKQFVEDYGISNGSDLKITITDNNFVRQQINQGF